MSDQREEKALREFKETAGELLSLVRSATGARTAWLAWVNRDRQQFVMEASRSIHPEIFFKDRVSFQDSFLQDYANQKELKRLRVGEELSTLQVDHHSEGERVKEVWLAPFLNNAETVAITVFEFEEEANRERVEREVHSYMRAFGGVLNTWLELMELHLEQKGWSEYEELMDRFSPRKHRAELVVSAADTIYQLMPTGSVTLLTRSAGVWMTVYSIGAGQSRLPLGTPLDEKSLAYEALQSGRPTFAIHFNQSPRRISTNEEGTEGATLAIPLLLDDHRQAVLVASDQNPLLFTESLKHKLIHLVRVAGLGMQGWLSREELGRDLFASESGSLLPDLWEKSLERELDRGRSDGIHASERLWFGLIAIDNIQEIRTAHRLESLKRLQTLLVTSLAPHRFNRQGVIGFHSEYVYAFLLQGRGADAVDQWMEEIEQMGRHAIQLSTDESIQLRLKAGYTTIRESEERDRHRLILDAKQALAVAIRSGEFAAGALEQDLRKGAGLRS